MGLPHSIRQDGWGSQAGQPTPQALAVGAYPHGVYGQTGGLVTVPELPVAFKPPPTAALMPQVEGNDCSGIPEPHHTGIPLF
jgi:hypothetical protein